MNRKGFTLVELLAVIVILALLALLTSTAVTKLVRDSKQELSDIQINSIKSASEVWGAENINRLPDNNQCIYITLDVLKQHGFLDSNIINPTNNKQIPNNLKIKISSEQAASGNSILKYEVNPKNVSNCDWAYPCHYSKDTDGSDMVTCGTESFYIIEKTEKHVIMLSKYNLTLTSNPIQDTTGETNGITFAETMYWYDTINKVYTVDVNYALERREPYIYNSNSKLYPYVEAYREVLEAIGVTVTDAKLLSYEQALQLGCTDDWYCESAPEWLGLTQYWLGTGGGDSIYLNEGGYLIMYNFEEYEFGIRPVITIPTYEIEL